MLSYKCYMWAIKTCHFYFWDNFGKHGPISVILSPLKSLMNCGGRQYKIYHISLNLLMHYFQNLNIEISQGSAATPIYRPYSSYPIQNSAKSIAGAVAKYRVNVKRRQRTPLRNKKVVLSQRWPRNAPYTWVPWQFSGLHDYVHSYYSQHFFTGFCSDRPSECSYKIGSP